MSSIALELDRTLRTLDKPASTALTNLVREAIHLVQADARPIVSAPRPDLAAWTHRLAERGMRLSTGKQGVPLQSVMDEIRG
jgi:hypothetical protein